ncbi:MAG: hypothetical protein ACRC6M_18530 [Microcystaceae cyanobacterium]
MEITLLERLESLKAGGIGAIAFSFCYGMAILINFWLHLPGSENFGFNLASSLLSGFLFGVTYRYIIRADQNPHLRDGAVLAFTLVRSGGLLEGLPTPLSQGLILSLGLAESLIGFGIARSCLDMAIARQWLKPFA